MTSRFPRLFNHFKFQSKIPMSIRPSSRLATRVPVRYIQTSPKEYNGLQTAAYHFKQQRHMPYFTEYLMWVIFGSEALHLIWLKIDMKEYKERMQLKTKLLEELIDRIEKGEVIDDNLRAEIKMVLLNKKQEHKQDDIDDEYLNTLIAASEQKENPEKVNKPKLESKWVDVQQEEGSKKKPFFL